MPHIRLVVTPIHLSPRPVQLVFPFLVYMPVSAGFLLGKCRQERNLGNKHSHFPCHIDGHPQISCTAAASTRGFIIPEGTLFCNLFNL